MVSRRYEESQLRCGEIFLGGEVPVFLVENGDRFSRITIQNSNTTELELDGDDTVLSEFYLGLLTPGLGAEVILGHFKELS